MTQIFFFSHTQEDPKSIGQFHGGAVRGISAAPAGHLMVSTGDAKVRVTDLDLKKVVAEEKFGVGGSSVEWLTDSTIVTGFDDGTVRLLAFGKLKVSY